MGIRDKINYHVDRKLLHACLLDERKHTIAIILRFEYLVQLQIHGKLIIM